MDDRCADCWGSRATTPNSRLPLVRLCALAASQSGRCQQEFSGRTGSMGPRSRPETVPEIELRFQRIAVKVICARNNRSRSWSAHGSYLSREGAAREGEKRGWALTRSARTCSCARL
jgi:hypothetical protein